MSEPVQISAFLICKNEEVVIERALKSLYWADEIVVVDGMSEDRTLEIVHKFTDHVYQRPWTNFGEQRNFALSKVKYPWTFFLDADEECSPGLIDWLRLFKSRGLESASRDLVPSTSQYLDPRGETATQIDLIEIRRLEHFHGRLYRYGANNPSYQWRLFRTKGAHFVGTIHEAVSVPGKIMRLEKPILHFPKADLSQVVSKMNRYTTLEAEQMFRAGKRKPVHYMFFSGLAMFLKAYFRKQGFRDGILGLILAFMDGSSFFLRQAKLYLLNKNA